MSTPYKPLKPKPPLTSPPDLGKQVNPDGEPKKTGPQRPQRRVVSGGRRPGDNPRKVHGGGKSKRRKSKRKSKRKSSKRKSSKRKSSKK